MSADRSAVHEGGSAHVACREGLHALRNKGFDLIEVPDDEAFTLGVNAMPLGADRVLSSCDARTLNAALRARGVTVLDPSLSMFAAGGGGAHCMAQALRRERCA